MRIIAVVALIVLHHSCFAQPKTITFPNACASGKSIIIAAVGDVLLHDPLQEKASKWGFDSLWQEALPFIQSANMAYANVEGPMAFGIDLAGREVTQHRNKNKNVYTGFPAFNYRPRLATTLKDSGFDIVSTANNHSLDRYAIGVDKTIKALDHAGLAYVGTRARGSRQDRVHTVHKDGFKIAWIACTQHTNGLDDTYQQVLHCYKKSDRQWMIDTIHELKSQVDAIIITPHWGEEYQSYPDGMQKYFAREVLDAGATAVIGSHPHVLQPLQKYITRDGRSTLIMYSLGNFVSYQGKPSTRSTIILLLGLTKTAEGTRINGVRFVPMYMQNRNGLQNMHLTRVPDDSANTGYKLISQILPMGNAWYETPVVTNPECR